MQTPPPLTRRERVAQCLVLVGVLGVLGAPFGWFGYGSLNHLHIGNPSWHAHGKFHLMWQGISYWILGGLALYGALRPRSREFRWLGVGLPWAVFLAYFLVKGLIAPALGVHNPLAHYPPIALGISSNEFWITVILLSGAAGLYLNLRSEQARAGVETSAPGRARLDVAQQRA